MTASEYPLFSVVMPSFNTDSFLAETIESVLTQDYPNIELIVMDGGSTDRSLEILKSYGDRISWTSEPDNGQSDAINKGFDRAKGELMYWANADDPLKPGALKHVAQQLTDFSQPQWLVGAADLINEKGRVLGKRSVETVDDSTFLLWGYKWIPTQSMFWNRKMWKAAGPFDLDRHYVMDMALWERMHRTAPVIISSRTLGCYRFHADAKSLTGVDKSRAERKKHLAGLLKRDIIEAIENGNGELDDLAQRYADLLDELTDQAVMVERLLNHRLTGPVVRAYKRRAFFFPDFKG